MAIIKCPECGQSISDKAPNCPNCGVQIAGKLTTCPQCGEVYFSDSDTCPHCHFHRHATTSQSPVQEPSTVRPEPAAPVSQPSAPQKNYRPFIIAAAIIAAAICLVGFFFYNGAQHDKEFEDYEYAMRSTDPMVLQSYLDRYKDAPTAHIDSIQAHLALIKLGDQEWTDAVISNSKEALQAYLTKNPDSPHKAEALDKIDAIDWDIAGKKNTKEGYHQYITDHPDGKFVVEAQAALDKVKASDVQPEEKQMIGNLFRQFFQSINERDEDELTATVSSIMSSFLGKQSATKSDVISFMRKIYKEDINSMNWRVSSGYKISKKEIGDGEYEYNVQFTAEQNIDRSDADKEKFATYKISAKVSPENKISAFNMTKVVR